MAAAAAASGIALSKDISGLEGTSVSRNMNGAATISTPFPNVGGPSDAAGVGPAPRVSLAILLN